VLKIKIINNHSLPQKYDSYSETNVAQFPINNDRFLDNKGRPLDKNSLSRRFTVLACKERKLSRFERFKRGSLGVVITISTLGAIWLNSKSSEYVSQLFSKTKKIVFIKEMPERELIDGKQFPLPKQFHKPKHNSQIHVPKTAEEHFNILNDDPILRNDKSLFLKTLCACQGSNWFFEKTIDLLPPELCSDREFMKEVLSHYPQAFRKVSGKDKNDQAYVLQLLKLNPDVYTFLESAWGGYKNPSSIAQDPTILWAMANAPLGTLNAIVIRDLIMNSLPLHEDVKFLAALYKHAGQEKSYFKEFWYDCTRHQNSAQDKRKNKIRDIQKSYAFWELVGGPDFARLKTHPCALAYFGDRDIDKMWEEGWDRTGNVDFNPEEWEAECADWSKSHKKFI
jgi:hypothetical protein